MIKQENLIRAYLQEHNIEFKELIHEPVGDPILYSQKLGTQLAQQAKALLLRCKDINNKRHFVVVTLPANKRVEFDKVAKVIGNTKSVRVAPKEKMKELTNCNPGELPPLAKLWGLQLIMDKDLLNEPEIYFNAGQLDYSIITSPQSIVNLENAILI